MLGQEDSLTRSDRGYWEGEEVLNSDSWKVNGAGDSSGLPHGQHHLSLTHHQVLCVPKLPEYLHDAITVDYSKESQSKCWQGNETGIAALVSGDMKPGRWAYRAWKGRELAIGTYTILRRRYGFELFSYSSNMNWIYSKTVLPRIKNSLHWAYHLECDDYLTLYWSKYVLKANWGTALCWFSFHNVLWPFQYSTHSTLSKSLAQICWWTKSLIDDDVAFLQLSSRLDAIPGQCRQWDPVTQFFVRL